MRKLGTLLTFLILGASIAFGQGKNCGQTNYCSGNISANAQIVYVSFPQNTTSTVVAVTGTFSGTLQIEQSADGQTWAAAIGNGSTTVPGSWTYSANGLVSFRVRASAFSSGTAVINITSSQSSGGGTGSGFPVTTSQHIQSGGTVTVDSGGGFVLASGSTFTPNVSIIPGTDNAIDLGSASKSWRDFYITGTIHFLGSGLLAISGTPGACTTAATGLGQLCLSSTGNRFVYSYNGGANTNVLLATDVIGILGGGTGQVTAQAGFDALSPLTTEGDLIYFHSGHNSRIPVGGEAQVMTVSGGAPAWQSIPCDPLNLTTVCLDEEFAGSRVNTPYIGDLGWTLTAIVGGSPTMNANYPQAWPWVTSSRLASANVSGNGAFLGLTPVGMTSTALSSQVGWDSFFAYAYGASSGHAYRVGYIMGGNVLAVPYNGFYSRFDPNLESITAATYTSGGAFTGTVGQTCNASFLGGTATATIALTGTNAIAGGTAFAMVSNGSGYYNVNPTTQATLTNGTATCSGTATVAVTNGAAGSGGDSTVKLCVETTNSYLETCYDTGLSADTNHHVLRVRGIASGKVGLTLDSGSEITFCSSGCTVTVAPTASSGLTPAFSVISYTAATSGILLCKFWRFKATGLAFF